MDGSKRQPPSWQCQKARETKNMATESIFHNFTITSPKEARQFAEALEKAAKKRPKSHNGKSKLVTDPAEIRKCFAKRNGGDNNA